jgi:tetratricopeptide (TPR) repeat protein
MARNQWADARTQLQQALAIDADEPYALASLATVESRLGNLAEAIEFIQRARLLVPNDVSIRVQHASLLRDNNRPREGVELLVGLPLNERSQEFVAAAIAECYLAMGQPVDAARAWEVCYQANMISPRAWFAAVNAGRCLLHAAEREQAWLWLEQAKQAAPSEPEVKALEQAIAATPRQSD